MEKDSSSKMKAINSEARHVLGIAKGFELEMGVCKGSASLIVALIGYFKVILGMDFLTSAKVVPMPH